MVTPLSAVEFFDRFPKAQEPNGAFGRYLDEADQIHYYYHNAAGEVGELVYEPRTTVSAYGMVHGEDATMLKSWYQLT